MSDPCVNAAPIGIDADFWSRHENRGPFRFEHDLVGDERLTHEAIVALAAKLPAEMVETNIAEMPDVYPSNDYISPALVHRIHTLGDEMSISLSLVFHTPSLDRGARVHAANHDLSRQGLSPLPFGRSRVRDATKSAAVLAWRRVKGLVGRCRRATIGAARA